MTVSNASFAFFPSSNVFRGIGGVLCASTGMKTPYPMKAEGRCLDIPRRCLS